MNDIFGCPLQIGDVVAFNPPAYKGLVKGKVVGFTAKMIKVEYDRGFGLSRRIDMDVTRVTQVARAPQANLWYKDDMGG
jgi:hypothetical protein